MQPVKVTILGSFWDSQIYSGELMLFDEEGSIHRIDWRAAIDDLAQKNQSIQTALRVAFLDGDLFYSAKVRKILLDPELATPIKQQLCKLSDTNLCNDIGDLSDYRSRESSPFDFLPTDTEIYYNTIFASGDVGLFSSPRASKSKNSFIFSRASKHHDGSIFQVKASDRYTSLATAAGDDGLLEFPFEKNDNSSGKTNAVGQSKILANRSCSACDWAFQSVMGWTADSAFFASFKEEKDSAGKGTVRRQDRVVEISEVFPGADNRNSNFRNRSIAWGAREKLYLLTDSGIEVVDYNPNSQKFGKKIKKNAEMFDLKGKINSNIDLNQVVATSTAPFGTVIELDESLMVLRSDGNIENFPGEPVHWRVFPRSEHYSNQLHILYEDRLEIISFVHDYFVNQSEKLAGFTRNVDNLVL